MSLYLYLFCSFNFVPNSLWVLRYQNDLREKALQAEQVYQDAAERLAEVRRHEDLCVLQHAKVIGMTTTGAAKYRQVLQQLKPRLVIVEEAAEVLEAHTITTLSRNCQHLILIGDHQQVQPAYSTCQSYSLTSWSPGKKCAAGYVGGIKKAKKPLQLIHLLY